MTNLVEVTIPQPPDAGGLVARQLVEAARSFEVVTASDFARAAETLRTIKTRSKEVDEQRKALVRPLDEARKRIQAFFAVPLGFLEEAEKTLKSKMLGYEQAEERRRLEAQRAAEAAARAERERLAREAAEAERKAREKAEAERKAAEEAAAAGRAEEAAKLAARAARTEAKGEERAAALAAQADHVVTEVVHVERPRAAGLASVTRWTFEVIDEAAIPRAYLAVDEEKLRRVVEAMKGDTDIPGVRAIPIKTMTAKSYGP